MSKKTWLICDSCGAIQIGEIFPTSHLYSRSHGSGLTGETWRQHHKLLAKIIASSGCRRVLEIGGGHGILSRLATEIKPATQWTIVDPTADQRSIAHATVISDFFDEQKITLQCDAVVHSHFLEHAHDPVRVLSGIWQILPAGGRHVFSIPDMRAMLERVQTNCITFEHTYMLDSETFDSALLRAGFEIISKTKFSDGHSVMYDTRKIEADKLVLAGSVSDSQILASRYFEHHKKDALAINSAVNLWDGDVYLFGAHVFSQSILSFGVNERAITGVLDNNLSKSGLRLYGTGLIVSGAQSISKARNPLVVLRAGSYNREIEDTLRSHRRDVVVI
jgi:hypothetical protein